jgi:hypothetical protein
VKRKLTAWSRSTTSSARLGSVAVRHVPMNHKSPHQSTTPSGIEVRFSSARGWEFRWPTSGPSLEDRLNADVALLHGRDEEDDP